MAIKTIWENRYLRKSIEVLQKLNFNVEANYYRKIHRFKKKVIKNLIPESLISLDRGSNKLSEEKISDDCPIYFFWWTGKDTMPPVVKMCYSRLLCKKGNHPVKLIDKSNITNIISQFPSAVKIMDWLESGKITIQYFSDILRSGLLYQNSGIWVDATVFIIKPIDEILLDKTFYSLKRFQENKYWIFVHEQRWSSYFLASSKNNKLMGFLFHSLIECIEKYGSVPEYFAIDYIIALGYENDKEIANYIDNIPPVKPNTGIFIQSKDEVSDELFFNVMESAPLLKLNWRTRIDEDTVKNPKTIFSRLSNY